jgi:kumamolisin
MPTRAGFCVVPGSEKTALPGATVVGSTNPDEVIEVTVLLRRQKDPPASDVKRAFAPVFGGRKYLDRQQYNSSYGAGADDISKIEKFAHEFGLAVAEIHPGSRTVKLSGTVGAFDKAFEVDLREFENPSIRYRGRTGAISVPAELDKIVLGVFGLDNRPVAKPHMRILRQPQVPLGTRAAAPSVPAGFTPVQVGTTYNFPPGFDGTGQCIAIIELGGGYKTADLNTYFKSLGLTSPSLSAVSVDHAANKPSGPNGADGEVMLDVEVVGAIAPKAKIVVYFAPNTDQGFLDAVNAAVHDGKNKPSILSISWGAPESSWTGQSLSAFNSAFQDAATMGVTVCAAAGDEGSTDGVTDGQLHVDFPGSSPFVLSCGGTNLKVVSGKPVESVWNELAKQEGAGGGGVSSVFPVPDYQSNLTLPKNSQGAAGRGVPDVAGDADPETGYQVRVDGQNMVIGGTSAVAPLWAGLLARVNQAAKKPVGFIHSVLYAAFPRGFHDITSGGNGAPGQPYQASKGYDVCSGLGTPDGTAILGVLAGTGSSKKAVGRK